MRNLQYGVTTMNCILVFGIACSECTKIRNPARSGNPNPALVRAGLAWPLSPPAPVPGE